VKKIGYGMGTKDFPVANCIRAFLYEGNISAEGGESDVVFELTCNIDDMTPEAIGAAFDVLLSKGALDVYTIPIMMKKNRQAVMLTCLCHDENRDDLVRQILEHTTTLGVRMTQCRRDTMSRSVDRVETEYGEIRVKRARGFGLAKEKPEYDDVLEAARQHNVPYKTVYDAAIDAAMNNGV
jgi:uncharacterized protein (DUF111 family)